MGLWRGDQDPGLTDDLDEEAEAERWRRVRARIGEKRWRRLCWWVQVARLSAFLVRLAAIGVAVGAIYMLGAALVNAVQERPPFPEHDREWSLFPPIVMGMFVIFYSVMRLLLPCTERRVHDALREAGEMEAESPSGDVHADEPQQKGPTLAEQSPTALAQGESDDEILALNEQWIWVRERIGHRAWTRLVGWRDTLLLLQRLVHYSGAATVLAMGMAFFGVGGTALLGKHLALARGLGHPLFTVPTLTALMSWMGTYVVHYLAARDLARVSLEGTGEETVARALWANYQAALLAAEQRRLGTRPLPSRATIRERAWWRVELSGVHLVLWASIPVIGLASRSPHSPDWMWMIGLFAGIAWVFKVCFLLLLLFSLANPDSGVRKAYRWFGTLRGTVAALVLVPLGFVAVGVGMSWLLELFQR